MGSVGRRLQAALLLLVLLFFGYVGGQLVVGERLQDRHTARVARLEAARDANVAALQHMTDAETGVRGFQLTGEAEFLQPYDRGRVGVYTSFNAVAANTGDPAVHRLLDRERAIATEWLTTYAAPIVAAGAAEPQEAVTKHGKDLFDRLRSGNAAVDSAIQAQQARTADAGRRRQRVAEVLFESLGALLVAGTVLVALWSRRMLLAPLGHIRDTLHRLAGGELSARAVPTGPPELREVIGTLNHLAAETERLHTADRARFQRTELRQAVAVELRDPREPAVTARRVAAMIGAALHADAVHGRVHLDATRVLEVCWPQDSAALSGRTVKDVLAAEPGVALDVPHLQGACAVAMADDGDCPPGLLYVARPAGPPWTDDERRLLGTLAREIDHAVRQCRLHDRQSRLIADLRLLDERKDAFVSTVTHELRTPLTSILGYTEMLNDGDGGELSALQQRGVAAILRNAHRLHATVADLLLLDKTGAAIGSGQPVAEPVDLATVLAAVHTRFAVVAESRGITLTGATESALVHGDAARLERAISNLVDNAVKFTGAGGHVTYRVAAQGGSVLLTVTDTGIGIPAGDLPGLFTPFHRAGNAMARAVQGPGLGLAIVRTIVTEHGGTVTTQSEVDRGSTFTVTLPGPGSPR
ncbi:ATP-binding protein [Actinoplanes sp. N902-109]|uniref:ATP-binding protein n=1 Tax=Actinoplanes sp. (strain N902-109) TaxID=649831 RepID=UPI0003293B9E|nr:ATP-binding protein [Actinoplanes sp. N902-109]AGL18190.1 Sensory transduction histidine kinase [Actinoplanes sp. N902-109]